MSFLHRRLRAFPVLLIVAAVPVFAAGCSSSTETGTLMLGMSTNLELPDDIAAVGLQVAAGDKTIFEEVHGVETKTRADGTTYQTVDLPSTFAVRSPPGGQAHVKVRVVAYDDTGTPIVLRSAEVDTPKSTIKLLRMNMDWMNLIQTPQAATETTPVITSAGGLHLTNDGAPKAFIKPSLVTDCDGGYDRQGGVCEAPRIVSDEELEAYSESDYFGDPDPAKCFDVAKSFAAKPLLIDLDSLVGTNDGRKITDCSFDPRTIDPEAQVDEARLNVAIVTPQIGGKKRGKCTAAKDGRAVCFAILNHAGDSSENDGWTYRDGKIRFPLGMCDDKFAFRRTAKLALTYGADAPPTRGRNAKACKKTDATSDLTGPQTWVSATKGAPLALDVWPSDRGLSVLSVSARGEVTVAKGISCGRATTRKESSITPAPTGQSGFLVRAGRSLLPGAASDGDPAILVVSPGARSAWVSPAAGLPFVNPPLDLLGGAIGVAATAETLFTAISDSNPNAHVSQTSASGAVKLTGIAEHLVAIEADEKRVNRASTGLLYGMFYDDTAQGYVLGRYNATACAAADSATAAATACKATIIGKAFGNVTNVGTMIVSNGYVYFTAFNESGAPGIGQIQRIQLPATASSATGLQNVASPVAKNLTITHADPIAATAQCVYSFTNGTAQGTRAIVCASLLTADTSSSVVDNLPDGSAGLAASAGTVFWGEPAAGSTTEGVVRCQLSN